MTSGDSTVYVPAFKFVFYVFFFVSGPIFGCDRLATPLGTFRGVRLYLSLSLFVYMLCCLFMSLIYIFILCP
jgi:hypothetical protein